MLLSQLQMNAANSGKRSYKATTELRSHDFQRSKAVRLVRCHANEEEEARKPNRWIVLSDWTAVEFWTNITQHAALPAAVATGLHYSQTHTFLPVHLPTANAVPTVLWMMAPVVILDLCLWNIFPHLNVDDGVRHGLHKYHMQKAETHRHQCMRLPPVQHNISRLALSLGRQFLLAMSMPVFLELIMEAQDHRPGCLPQLSGVPGLEGMDAGVVGSVMMLSVALWMASEKVELTKQLLHKDDRDRAMAQFIMSSECDIEPFPGQPGSSAVDSDCIAARVAGLRFALLTACCSLVFLRSESIIASGWISYVAANIEYRLIILNLFRLPSRDRRRSY